MIIINCFLTKAKISAGFLNVDNTNRTKIESLPLTQENAGPEAAAGFPVRSVSSRHLLILRPRTETYEHF
jgi:hypothetical protein